MAVPAANAAGAVGSGDAGRARSAGSAGSARQRSHAVTRRCGMGGEQPRCIDGLAQPLELDIHQLRGDLGAARALGQPLTTPSRGGLKQHQSPIAPPGHELSEVDSGLPSCRLVRLTAEVQAVGNRAGPRGLDRDRDLISGIF